MKTKLKPCPFCGLSFLKIHKLRPKGCYAVSCSKCLFFGPVEFYKKDAIEAWNRRAGDNNASNS